MRSYLSYLPSGRIRQALSHGPTILVAGAMASQVIAFVASTALTRLYNSSEMGIFALYTSAIAILTLISTGRYDLAVISPSRDNSAQALVALVIRIAVTGLAISLPLVAIWMMLMPQSTAMEGSGRAWMFAVPLGVCLSAIQAAGFAYLTRKAAYRKIAALRILLSGTAAALSIGFGWLQFGYWGLIVASLLSLSIAGVAIHSMMRFHPLEIPGRHLAMVARQYSKFPKVDLPSSLIGVVGTQLPTLLLGIVFGSTFLGLYAIVERVCLAPIAIIGGAYGSVFRVNATRSAARSESFRKEYLRTLLVLTCISALCFGPIVIIGPSLFAFLFGTDWRQSGAIAQMLAPLYFIRLIALPLSMTLYVRNRMELDFFGQLALGASSLISIVAGWKLNDPWLTLRMLTIGNSLIYVGYIVVGWMLSKAR